MMLTIRRGHKQFLTVFNTEPFFRQKRGKGLLSTAGLINGRFGSGDRLHVAAWKTKKRVIRIEDSEDEKTIIREREAGWRAAQPI